MTLNKIIFFSILIVQLLSPAHCAVWMIKSGEATQSVLQSDLLWRVEKRFTTGSSRSLINNTISPSYDLTGTPTFNVHGNLPKGTYLLPDGNGRFYLSVYYFYASQNAAVQEYILYPDGSVSHTRNEPGNIGQDGFFGSGGVCLLPSIYLQTNEELTETTVQMEFTGYNSQLQPRGSRLTCTWKWERYLPQPKLTVVPSVLEIAGTTSNVFIDEIELQTSEVILSNKPSIGADNVYGNIIWSRKGASSGLDIELSTEQGVWPSSESIRMRLGDNMHVQVKVSGQRAGKLTESVLFNFELL